MRDLLELLDEQEKGIKGGITDSERELDKSLLLLENFNNRQSIDRQSIVSDITDDDNTSGIINEENTEKINVIVIDDSLTARKFIGTRLILNKEFNVFEADKGEEGVEMLDYFHNKRVRIDIIFLDMRLPKRDGYEIGEKLNRRKEHYKMGYYIIIVSGHGATKGDIKWMTENNISGWIKKPFQSYKLKEILDNCNIKLN